MEIQIKKTIKAGNSSAVILPRSWLNKEVRVEIVKKTPETILSDVITIVRKYIDLEEIIGIYLTGSYARNEENKYSDIDILVITNDTDKEMLKEGIYNILLVSEKLLYRKLEQDLLPIGQMIKEAKALLNYSYLNSIKIKVTYENVKWYIDTTEDKLKILEKVIKISREKNKWNLSDFVAYTLILRIRTLYIIEKLIKDKTYKKDDFIRLIRDISKKDSYEKYLAIKNNMKDEYRVTLKETESLYSYLNSQLSKIKKILKKTK